LTKDLTPTDNRRYNLNITASGSELIADLSAYSAPIMEELHDFEEAELVGVFQTITKLIFKLNQRGIIQVQRTCFNCKYYKGDRSANHFCNLMEKSLKVSEIRLDCQEFENLEPAV
jgi:hypothetical protein